MAQKGGHSRCVVCGQFIRIIPNAPKEGVCEKHAGEALPIEPEGGLMR